MARYWCGKSWPVIHSPVPALGRAPHSRRFPAVPPGAVCELPARRERPLRAAMARATMLCDFGRAAEALAEVMQARRGTPFDGSALSSDEAAALAEGWEFQAAEDLCRGRLEAGLEDLAIAEQILDGRPEHSELRGRICVQLAARLSPSTPELRSIRAEYLGRACYFLEGADEYRELLDALRDGA